MNEKDKPKDKFNPIDETNKTTTHQAKTNSARDEHHTSEKHETPSGASPAEATEHNDDFLNEAHLHHEFEHVAQVISKTEGLLKLGKDKVAKEVLKAAHELNAKLKSNVAELQEKLQALGHKVESLEHENARNIAMFREKAEALQTKAQAELGKFREALAARFTIEKQEHSKFALQKLVEDLAEPLLNFDLAISSGEKQTGAIGAYVKGFEMLLDQVNGALAKHNVHIFAPQVGDKFNHEEHHVIGKIKREDLAPEIIVEVKKKGYKLGGRIIKPALVIISEKSS